MQEDLNKFKKYKKLISFLDDIVWLLNLRGDNLIYNLSNIIIRFFLVILFLGRILMNYLLNYL